MDPISKNDLELLKLRFFVLYFRYKYIDAPSTLYAIQDICGQNDIPVYKRFVYARNYFNYSRLFGSRVVSQFENIGSNECEKLRKKVNGVLQKIEASDIRMSKKIVMDLKKIDDVIISDWIQTIEGIGDKPDSSINRYYNKKPILKLLKNVDVMYKKVQGKYINSDTRNTRICEVIQNFDPIAFYNNTVDEVFKFFDVKINLMTIKNSSFVDYLTKDLFNESGAIHDKYIDLHDKSNKEVVALLERIGQLQKKSSKIETSAGVLIQDYRDLEQKKIYNHDIVDELEERVDKANNEVKTKDKQIGKLVKNIDGLGGKLQKIKDRLGSKTNTEYKAKEIRKLEKALKKVLKEKQSLEKDLESKKEAVREVEQLDKMIQAKITLTKKDEKKVEDKMKRIEGLLKKSKVNVNKELRPKKGSKNRKFSKGKKRVNVPPGIKKKINDSQKKLKEINKELKAINSLISKKGSKMFVKE